MKRIYRLLFALHVFVGVGAVFGGLAAITSPKAPLGIPVEILRSSPFSDFFIPGIILFTLIGLGNIVCAFMFRFKLRYQGYISSVFSWALVIWIVVQCKMLNSIEALHIIYFIIGLIQASLSIFFLYEQRLFPINLFLNLYKGVKKEF